MSQTLAHQEKTWSGADECCDRCGAGAKLRVVLTSGADLVFCGHHANRYAENLAKVAVAAQTGPDFVWTAA